MKKYFISFFPLILGMVWFLVGVRAVEAMTQHVSSTDHVLQQEKIKVESLLSLDQKKRIKLSLFDKKVTIRRERLKKFEQNRWVWVGTIDHDPAQLALFSVYHGVLSGEIAFNSNLYQIHKSKGKQYTLQKVKTDSFDHGHPIEDDTTDEAVAKQSVSTTSDDGTRVDLLVPYTAQAVKAAGGEAAIRARIDLAVEYFNQVNINSKVDLTIRLVHAQQVDYDEDVYWDEAYADTLNEEELSEYALDVWAAIMDDLYLGRIEPVFALRDSYHADIVSMVIDRDELPGISFTMSAYLLGPTFESNAFNLLSQTALEIQADSLAHESGHNMGLAHDRDSEFKILKSILGGAYDYSYGYLDPAGKFRDVQAYPTYCTVDGGCLKIPYWSTPDVKYNGSPLGIRACDDPDKPNVADCDDENSADNVRTLENTKELVSNFRTTSSLNTTTITPPYNPSTDGGFGSVNVVADFNGDGCNDIVMGSKRANAGFGTDSGAVYVYLGCQSVPTVHLVIQGNEAGGMLGSSLALLADDVSGDNLPDLIIGGSGVDENLGKGYIVTSDTINAATAGTTTNIENASTFEFQDRNGSNLDADITRYVTSSGAIYYLWMSAFSGDDLTGAIFIFKPETLAAITTASSHSTVYYLDQEADGIISGEADFTTGNFTDITVWDEADYLLVQNYTYDSSTGRVFVIKDSTIDSFIAENPMLPRTITQLDAAILLGSEAFDHFGYTIVLLGDTSDETQYVVISAPYRNDSQGSVYALSQTFIQEKIAAGVTNIVAEVSAPFTAMGETAGDLFGINMLAGNNASTNDFLFIAAPEYFNGMGRVYIYDHSQLSNDDGCLLASTCDLREINGEPDSGFGGSALEYMTEDFDADGLGEMFVADEYSDAGTLYLFTSSTYTKDDEFFTVQDADGQIAVATDSGSTFGNSLTIANLDTPGHDQQGDYDFLVGAPGADTVMLVYNIEDVFGLSEHYLAVGMEHGLYTIYAVEENGSEFDQTFQETLNANYDVQVAAGSFKTDAAPEFIAVSQESATCHTVYFRSSVGKEIQEPFKKLCHPDNYASYVYIAAANVDGQGLDEIIAVFPLKNNTGFIIQIYQQKNGQWKSLAKSAPISAEFTALSVAAGSLDAQGVPNYIAVAPTTGSKTVYLYAFTGTAIEKVLKQNVVDNNISLSIDNEHQYLYTASKNEGGRIRAYALAGSALTEVTGAAFQSVSGDVMNITTMNELITIVGQQSDITKTVHYASQVPQAEELTEELIVSLSGSSVQYAE